MSDLEGCCHTCKYWDVAAIVDRPDAALPSEAEGRCRRFPPAPDPQSPVGPGGLVEALYVRTSGLDWCGEWRHRKTSAGAESPEGSTPAIEEPGGPREPSPILDENSYDRLRRLYTAEELRALVLDGGETDDAALRELARLEDIYRQRRGES